MEHFKRVSAYESPRARGIFPELVPAEPVLVALASPQHAVTGWALGRRSHALVLLETVAVRAYLSAGAAALVVTVYAFLVHLLP